MSFGAITRGGSRGRLLVLAHLMMSVDLVSVCMRVLGGWCLPTTASAWRALNGVGWPLIGWAVGCVRVCISLSVSVPLRLDLQVSGQLIVSSPVSSINTGIGTCLVLSDSSAKCFGQGTYGQLGQDSTDDLGDGAGEMGDNLPTIQLGTGLTVLSISAGGGYNCVVLSDSSTKCFGRGGNGQLGQEGTDDLEATTPMRWGTICQRSAWAAG